MKIRRILVSQPEPESEKSPYYDLARDNNVKIDFRPFIQVEGIPAREFRKSKVDILEHTAVIFNSKTSVDNYFRICEEMRLTVPDTMKYFCVSESVAYYLQKYIVYRKRKIFFGKQRFDELIEVLKKHCNEKYLVPVSASHKDEIPKKLTKIKIKYTKAVLYRTVNSDLSDLVSTDYDMMIFYSPSGVKSLLKNFPDFEQKDMKIASFGPATAKAVKEAGLRLDLQAPMPKAPSMTMAVDLYIKKLNGKKKAVEVAEEEDS